MGVKLRLSVREELLIAQAVHSVNVAKPVEQETLDWTEVSRQLRQYLLQARPGGEKLQVDLDPVACCDAYRSFCQKYVKSGPENARTPALTLQVVQTIYQERFRCILSALEQEKKKRESLALEIEAINLGEWDEKLGIGEGSQVTESLQVQHMPSPGPVSQALSVSEGSSRAQVEPGTQKEQPRIKDSAALNGTRWIYCATCLFRLLSGADVLFCLCVGDGGLGAGAARTTQIVAENASATQTDSIKPATSSSRNRKRKGGPGSKPVLSQSPTSALEGPKLQNKAKKPDGLNASPVLGDAKTPLNDTSHSPAPHVDPPVKDPCRDQDDRASTEQSTSNHQPKPSSFHLDKTIAMDDAMETDYRNLRAGYYASNEKFGFDRTQGGDRHPSSSDSTISACDAVEEIPAQLATTSRKTVDESVKNPQEGGKPSPSSPGLGKKARMEIDAQVEEAGVDTPNSTSFPTGVTEGSSTAYQTPGSTEMLLPTCDHPAITRSVPASQGDPTFFRRRMLKTHSSVQSNPISAVFRKPVKESDAPGYSSIVKRPMDLQTLAKKLREGQISTAEEYRRDLMLMLANAIMFNHEDSQVSKTAKELMIDCDRLVSIFMRGSRY